jgi:peptide/nickel transport system ATP-binding protein
VSAPLLTVTDLRVTFEGDRSVTEAVAGVSFSLMPGRTLGIVGESGCGKSVTALSIMRLLPSTGTRVSGSVVFEGRELTALSEPQMQDLRGNRLAMIFQEPMTSLNPSFTVGDQIGEALMRHRGLSAKAARQAAIDMLARVRIPSPRERVDEYPHKLSGGMRQRVMIAMALVCAPALLIADEPTTALDVTIQAQILELLAELRRATGSAIILITHDLGVVAETCDDVAVMYAGEIVEQAPAARIFSAPQHPYTVGLLGSIPLIGTRRARLATIAGSVPSLAGAFVGCRFASRCPFADARCRTEPPPLAEVGVGHVSRCWKAPLERLVAPRADDRIPSEQGI